LLDDGIVDRSRRHGPPQVTDAYLLALAVLPMLHAGSPWIPAATGSSA